MLENWEITDIEPPFNSELCRKVQNYMFATKKEYTSLECNVVIFDNEDIVTTSTLSDKQMNSYSVLTY